MGAGCWDAVVEERLNFPAGCADNRKCMQESPAPTALGQSVVNSLDAVPERVARLAKATFALYRPAPTERNAAADQDAPPCKTSLASV